MRDNFEKQSPSKLIFAYIIINHKISNFSMHKEHKKNVFFTFEIVSLNREIRKFGKILIILAGTRKVYKGLNFQVSNCNH